MSADDPSLPADSFLEDLTSGLVRQNDDAPGRYAPRLIANHAGTTMGDALSEELQRSDTFDISVAFVTAGTVRTLFQDFLDQEQRRVRADARPGRIITSTKGYFNRPEAFRDLLRLKSTTGADVRVWNGRAAGRSGRGADAGYAGAGQPFHPKGYIFAHRMEDGKPYVNLYVGSSNLTDAALGTQREWNLRVSSMEDGDLVQQVRQEIDDQVAESEPLTEKWIERYEEDFRRYAPPRRGAAGKTDDEPIRPNRMQREALASLARLRDQGERRAIVISATGTGKTYLSAFDVQQVHPHRMLYLAHREQILKTARDKYRRVLGGPAKDYGLLSGTSKQSRCRYVFATVQTLSKPETLDGFAPDAFDYILVDEAHHAGAAAYRRVLDHFSDAGFLLGMTATPERTDGQNIFELFGNNVAYEIRLQQALDENMLCPFHYYGVAEYLGSDEDGENGSVRRLDVAHDRTDADAGQLVYEIGQLASSKRVRYIIDTLQKYTPYHQQIRGLVFCSRVDEARRLSALFNEETNQQAERLYRTVALDGANSTDIQREKAAHRLQLDDGELDKDGDPSLDYIFTVDLFNEGIDIPPVNQIVMLRNTQSSIVFTQQLGRGLRKVDGKDDVIVVDFIGNYANNYMIDVALYGNGGDRDTARRNLQRRSIGLSSISFDPIARERVLRSIDQADWSEMKRLSELYRQLRFQLGRIPMLADVYRHDPSMPATVAAKQDNYLGFVRSRERSLGRGADGSSFLDLLDPVTDVEDAILKMATELLLPGLRPHELVILDELCRFPEELIDGKAGKTGKDAKAGSWRPSGTALPVDELAAAIARRFPDAYQDRSQTTSALAVLDGSYYNERSRKRFGGTPLVEVSQDGRNVRLGGSFAAMLAGNRTFRVFFADTLRCGLVNCRDLFERAARDGRTLDRGFLVEQKYKVSDVERLLGWPKEMNAQNIGGYFCHRETGTMPIFVKYAASQYEDRFLGPQDLHYYSKNLRTPQSPEFGWMNEGAGEPGWADSHFIPLFVMRREEEKERRYYYVGHVSAFSKPALTSKPSADGSESVRVTVTDLRLAQPLDAELYRHLTGSASV